MPRQPTLKQLKRQWYAKLRREGFVDIEYANGSIKAGHARRASRNFTYIRAKMEYYTMCTHFLNEYKFEEELHKVVWEYHSNGISYRDIARTLKALPYKLRKSHMWVARLINALEKQMKEKYLSV